MRAIEKKERSECVCEVVKMMIIHPGVFTDVYGWGVALYSNLRIVAT